LRNDIIPIITKNLTPSRSYVEPFCGGLNIIRHIHHPRRIANDSNSLLQKMWRSIQTGEFKQDDFYTREKYEDIKRDYQSGGTKYSDAEKAFAGYTCSWRGIFFHSFNTSNTQKREYQKLASYRVLNGVSYSSKEKSVGLEGITFKSVDYKELYIPEGSIVYCDPPYRNCNSDSYSVDKSFDYAEYYLWLIQTACSSEVYVSELSMPEEHFEVVWSKDFTHQLKSNRNVCERLYRVKRSSIRKIRKLNTFLIAYLKSLLAYATVVVNALVNDICLNVFNTLLYPTEYNSNSPPFSSSI
jgi:DNA adenine methylase